MKKSINKSIYNKSKEWWQKWAGQRDAKKFTKEQRLEFTRDLLSDKKSVKMIVGLLIGHYRLNRHMHDIDLAEDVIICRL